MTEHDTRVWRRKHGIAPRAQAVLLFSTRITALTKLKAVLHLHGLVYSEPLANSVLISAEPGLLTQVVQQWRDDLSIAEIMEVRGAPFESTIPSPQELASAPLQLAGLDEVLSRMDARWLVQLLAAGSCFTVFQPLISIRERRIIAYECLLRGLRAGNEVSPEKLFSTAKQLGISRELEHLAWRKAIEQGRALAERGHLLFLNFTPSAVYDPKFGVDETRKICAENKINLNQIVLEVTEAEKVHDINYLQVVMREYRTAGAKVALDDLGSGHSSVLHLSDLKPDFIKLDQRLVRGAHADYVRSVFLKAISDAAHALGIQVVAEGIETLEDLKYCVSIGADILQGYYLACPAQVPPVVSEEAIREIERWVRISPQTA